MVMLWSFAVLETTLGGFGFGWTMVGFWLFRVYDFGWVVGIVFVMVVS